MTQSSTMTIRMESELKERLDKLAQVTRRSKSFLAAEAVREYLALNDWQIQEINAALTEANAEDFASDEEVATTFSKWGVNAD
ncbi:MAG: ribbon-helix-helix protein, CopG family [Gammaproteobacteria bacterium]|nr:ribbon-helix-helix protein, CopG family [Gammaproteobacteria bacterium]